MNGSWNAVAPEVFAEHWKVFVALPTPPKMAELATAPGKVVRKYFKCLILKDDKLTTTLSAWFVLTIESDIKALLALHKESERLEKELERKIYDDEKLDLYRQNAKNEKTNAHYTKRYAWVLYLFSRAIQNCVTKDRAYDGITSRRSTCRIQEGWLDSIRKQLMLLEKTPRPK